MARHTTFGKRGQQGSASFKAETPRPQVVHQDIDGYKDPILIEFAVSRSWPAFAAAGITLTVVASALFVVGDVSLQTLALLVPVVSIVGVIMYLQFKGMQKAMQGEKEKRKRAIQAKYPLVPIGGLIAGAVYFMITRDQSISDILAYDWSGIFGLRTNIAGEEPLNAQLFDTMAKGGGAGVAVAALWYKISKRNSAEIA